MSTLMLKRCYIMSMFGFCLSDGDPTLTGGCKHNCVYCNARYTHEYLELPTGEFPIKFSSNIM
ncbi:MAG: hypothetical protein ACUVXA_18650 [Candidatus Jordarchaeum sp.]|uniref:hypothetical protein n=1 Tax=Candidatus Jordarchaeum sp. TaxID=2823881 RepID=UPI00404AE0ED